MALANRCRVHNTRPEIYRYQSEGKGWTIVLYCADCDNNGDGNSTGGSASIQDEVAEWNKMNPVQEDG